MIEKLISFYYIFCAQPVKWLTQQSVIDSIMYLGKSNLIKVNDFQCLYGKYAPKYVTNIYLRIAPGYFLACISYLCVLKRYVITSNCKTFNHTTSLLKINIFHHSDDIQYIFLCNYPISFFLIILIQGLTYKYNSTTQSNLQIYFLNFAVGVTHGKPLQVSFIWQGNITVTISNERCHYDIYDVAPPYVSIEV